MKLSTVIKISLSALAITVSMPMKSEASQAMLARMQARRAAEQAERERLLAAEALAQQQAAPVLVQQPVQAQVQQQVLEEQRRRNEEAQQRLEAQQALARQQEEQRRREEVERRQREEVARQHALNQEQALARQQEEQRRREKAERRQREEEEIQKKKAQAVSIPNLQPAWAFLRDIKANYLVVDGTVEQQAHEIATEEVQAYSLDQLKREAQLFSQAYLFGTDRKGFMEEFNSKLEEPLKIVKVPQQEKELKVNRVQQAKETPQQRHHRLFQTIQTHHQEELKRRTEALNTIPLLEAGIQKIDKELEQLDERIEEAKRLLNKELKAQLKEKRGTLSDEKWALNEKKAACEANLAITNFTYLNPNLEERISTEDKINTILTAALLIDPNLEEKAALFFTRSVSHAPKTGENIHQRIAYTLQAFEMMKLYNRGLTISNLEISSKNNQLFARAKDNLSPVHQYIQETFPGNNLDEARLDKNSFQQAIRDLKVAIEMGVHDYFDESSSRTLNDGYRIIKLNKGLIEDRKVCGDYFQRRQDELYNQVNPITPNYFYFSADNIDFNLYNEWNSIGETIHLISANKIKEGSVLSLCYDNLTYNDIYASFFDVKFKATSNEDIKAISDRIIFLADKRNMVDTAVCEPVHQGAVRNADEYVYFTEGRQDYRLKSTEIAQSRRYFKHQTKTNFEKILTEERKKYRFMERVKHIFDTVPETCISLEIMNIGKESREWQEALEQAQLEIAVRIVPSLDDCDGGMSRKLSQLEFCYRNILNDVKCEVPLIKDVASIIRGIKIDRINETGNHPQYDTNFTNAYEEHMTAPDILMQRLRGPLGLLGTYTNPVAPYYGKPSEAKNQPEQIIKNIFLPNQADRPYDIYEKGMQYDFIQIEEPIIVDGHFVELGNGTVATEMVEVLREKEVEEVIRQQHVAIKGTPLTVKSLIQQLKAEYEHGHTLTSFHDHIDSFIEGDLELLRDRDISVNGGHKTVFFTERTLPNDALFFHVLKRLGMAQVLPTGGLSEQDATKQLYACHVKPDENGEDENDIIAIPGTINIRGHDKSLDDLIKDELY